MSKISIIANAELRAKRIINKRFRTLLERALHEIQYYTSSHENYIRVLTMIFELLNQKTLIDIKHVEDAPALITAGLLDNCCHFHIEINVVCRKKKPAEIFITGICDLDLTDGYKVPDRFRYMEIEREGSIVYSHRVSDQYESANNPMIDGDTSYRIFQLCK